MATAYDLTLEQLTERLVAWGEPAFRAKQVYAQLWRRGATYEEMSDVSGLLRERLDSELPLLVETVAERIADRGATRKALLRLGSDGHMVETVLMGYPERVTVFGESAGAFSIGDAVVSFSYLALGGVAVGSIAMGLGG